MTIFAQIDSLRPLDAGAVVGFVLLTVAFLVLSAIVVWMVRSQEARLMLLGILVGVVGTGYATIVAVPTVSLAAPTMMKIAVILVLGSVACSVLSSMSKRPTGPEPQEPSNV